MKRTFTYSFEPPHLDPVSPTGSSTISLSTRHIEDAGVREVLQTPGAALGSWALLDALLHPTGAGTPFLFRQPLGHAREVKVALSGLFGRFVARAYLEHYLGLSIFIHLAGDRMVVDASRRIEVVRLENGDLPDWVACATGRTKLTVAEAKGSHDWFGGEQTLERAWTQVQRVAIKVRGKRVSVKRIAVVTRWGAATIGPADARLIVRDPDEAGEPISPDEERALFDGLFRLHLANLIEPLGHAELARSLRAFNESPTVDGQRAARAQARRALRRAGVIDAGAGMTNTAVGPLVGGILTRAGPLRAASLSASDRETLTRLDLRPMFVGVELGVLKDAVEGDQPLAQPHLDQTTQSNLSAPTEHAGNWIIPLSEG